MNIFHRPICMQAKCNLKKRKSKVTWSSCKQQWNPGSECNETDYQAFGTSISVSGIPHIFIVFVAKIRLQMYNFACWNVCYFLALACGLMCKHSRDIANQTLPLIDELTSFAYYWSGGGAQRKLVVFKTRESLREQRLSRGGASVKPELLSQTIIRGLLNSAA